MMSVIAPTTDEQDDFRDWEEWPAKAGLSREGRSCSGGLGVEALPIAETRGR